MTIPETISRVTEFYGRHGFVATLRRVRLGAARLLSAGGSVVFYCDLSANVLLKTSDPGIITVRKIAGSTELQAEDAEKMTSFWNEKVAKKHVRERFEKGATLWQARLGGQLAGYGWTLRGATIEPYFLPLTPDDVHLFDFHVFPEFRGRGINPYLVSEILAALKEEGRSRAFIETAEWNEAQLLSLRKTPVRYLGTVRSFKLLGKTFVSWKKSRQEFDRAATIQH